MKTFIFTIAILIASPITMADEFVLLPGQSGALDIVQNPVLRVQKKEAPKTEKEKEKKIKKAEFIQIVLV